jgi:hypothetical protein
MIEVSSAPAVRVYKERVRHKGQPVTVDAAEVNQQIFVVTGRLLRTAALQRYVSEDMSDPVLVSRLLKQLRQRVDVLRFWQRVPHTTPQYGYFREWIDVAAIPVSTHKQWFEKQICQNARNKIRKATRAGLSIRVECLNDELVRGIMAIYNDSPVRRGKRFWHYGKDFETVRAELREDSEKSLFLTAYDGDELIGFIKMLLEDRFARTTLILDKLSRRGKSASPMNSLLSKAVEICADRQIPYFVYSTWRQGEHGHFQQSNGFVKVTLPEYFVPLTLRGRVALLLRLHRGIRGRLPEGVVTWLLDLRARWYALRFRTSPRRAARGAQ